MPRKNVKMLFGKPLIAWTIEQARASSLVDKVVVSTDDEQIASVSRNYGAETPFIRPKKFATDSASSVDVALHAYEFLRGSGEHFDYLALLEPTSPLRKTGDIDRGIRTLLDSHEPDCLISVGRIHLEDPTMSQRMDNGVLVPFFSERKHEGGKGQQAYFPYGVIYLMSIPKLYKERTFIPERSVPLLIERWQNFEVDDELDLFVIDKIVRKYHQHI